MEVRIDWEKHELDHFRDGRWRLSAIFRDPQTGTKYRWVPRWKDAEELFFQAALTEALNKEDSPYLIRFADTAKVVVKMEPQRTKRGKTRFRVRSAELDTCLYAKDHLEALNEGIKEADKSRKTLALFTTVAEIVDNVEMHKIYYDTTKHLKELGFKVAEDKKVV